MKTTEINDIQDKLFQLADPKYKEFHSGLLPNIEKEKFIGVRVPALRRLAKKLIKEWDLTKVEKFLSAVPHQYYEENQLHSFIIDYLNDDFETCLQRTEKFLPEINNWAVCDSFKPSALKKDPKKLYEHMEKWMTSPEPYTVRLAIVLQISWFLDQWFRPEMLEKIQQVANKWSDNYHAIPEKNSDQYYVLMAVAWYYSMALAKQKNETMKILKEEKLPKWVYNKSLQKAVESTVFSRAEKDQFRRMKVK